MKRIAQEHLKQWFYKKNRQPLIVRGARQVGKSTLIRLFAETEKLQLIEINLEITKLNSVTEEDFNILHLLDEIQLKTKKKIDEKSVIFFDEIQDSPKLLKYLRYFYELRPEIAVISAGSLLEIALKNEEFSFPVGRIEFYHLGPMNFTEFLWATNNHLLYEKLEQLDFSHTVASLAKSQLRDFYYVGGMPRAIKVFTEEKSLLRVREVQNQIIQTYLADFPKYNKRINIERVEKIFFSTIHHLGKKIIYQKLDNDSTSREIRKALELLIEARVLLRCYHTESNSVPLAGEADIGIMKVYFLDVGLVNAMMKLDLDVIDSEMKNNFNTKGMIAEQFVAQHLAYFSSPSLAPELFYWLRDKGSQKGEVDFVIQKNNKIIPIEVKAAAAGHLKSLFYFSKEKQNSIAVKISLDPFSVQQINHKISELQVKIKLNAIPQYAIAELEKILDKN